MVGKPVMNIPGHQTDLRKIIPYQVMELIDPFGFKSVYELGNKKTGDCPYSIYYQSIGVQYSSIDLNGLDGALQLDLSKPIDLPPRDAVINIGTSEHIMDQQEVFRNIHNLSTARMIHWVPLAEKHVGHGYWGYCLDFFTELGDLNSYLIEKAYIERRYINWELVCCSYRKTEKTRAVFVWSDNLMQTLTYNKHGAGGVDYR